MGRPGNWTLLGVDGDPLPDDGSWVSTEATHYIQTATTIRDQVARLRRIGSGSNELVGQYAPALEDSANDLADHLDQSQGRFDTVASELRRWEPVLAHGYATSGSLLREAESHQGDIDANQPPHAPVDPTDEHAVAEDHRRATRLSDAHGALAGAVKRFHDLMHDVDSTASDVAKKIKDASHDQLKDSWWDKHVRKWIHDHAALLSMIADILTWIATAIIIAIVVFGTGGLALAVLLTAGALLLHSVLALNGDGSWVDVAIDAFALLTMGSGKLLTEGARGAYAARMGIEGFSESTSAARAAFANAEGFISRASVWLTQSNPLVRTFSGVARGMGRFSEAMSAEFRGGALLEALTMGDKEAAGLYSAVNQAIDRLGPGALLGSSRAMLNTLRPVFVSSVTADFTMKALNNANLGVLQYGGLDSWVEWKEEHTVRHGGFW